MAKTKISEFSSTPANNTDIDSINIAEGCAPSGINNAIRELMAQLKDFQTGAAGDSFNGPVGTTTAAAGAFTTLSASGTVSGTGFSNYLASPPAIGGTTAAAGSFTTLTTSGAVTHNAGTANGVAYLNGSKVLTTGSALTFDGSSLTASGFLIANAGFYARSGGALTLWNSTNGNASSLSTPAGTGQMAFSTGAGEQMRLTDTGLGIGTSSPGYKLQVQMPSSGVGVLFRYTGGTNNPGLFFSTNESTAVSTIDASGSLTGILALATVGTEHARIDSSGNLLVGTTSSSGAERFAVLGLSSAATASLQVGANGNTCVNFRNASGTVAGTIVVNASTTAYNTSSDYRLKNVIGAVSGAGERIDALEPIEYEWKVDGSRTRGFLAHKFQEVYAGSVTGTKDAVDAEGKPVYQAMQASSSEVIADLVAEIQSLRQRLAAAGI